jgi:hypothetical protein
MRKDIAMLVDTNSNYSDIWEPCFSRMNKYNTGVKTYVFTDKADNIPQEYIPVLYDNTASYRNQLLSCLKQISDKYIIYTSEDYILYDFAQHDEIEKVANLLDETEYSFCKFIKGPERTSHLRDNIYIIDSQDNNFFAQQASIWKTRDFEKVFEAAPSENTRMQHEPGGSAICRELGLSGIQYYSDTKKRGIHHYDSEIYPCIATAVVKGLWNLSEYPIEMKEVVKEFKINCNDRGWR